MSEELDVWNDDRQLLLLPSQIITSRRYADNSGGVSFRSTLEMSSKEMAVIDIFLRNKTIGQLAFAANRVQLAQIPKEDVDHDIKSQAQVIRNKCFRLHKKKEEAGEDSDYDALYRKATNWLIARLDEQIAQYD